MEGEGFRDRTPQFHENGVRVFGISHDSVEDNASWADLMGFQFPLLSDPSREAGVLLEAERDPDDRWYPAPLRLTYLVDPEGVIRRSYRVARDDLATHAEQILADLDALKKEAQ